MNRYILPSVGVVVLALLLFHSRSRDDGSDRGALLGTDHQAEPVANVEVADDDKEHKPNNKLSINASQISANRETEPYNPRFLNLPDYRARVDKHLRLKLYNSSPAKDTPECKEIEEILKGYGLGIASVFDAYSIAYRYHHEILPMIEHVTDEEDRNGLIEQIQGGEIDSFLTRNELKDDAIIREILKIKPVSFFGNILTDVGLQSGDRLLVN